MVIKKIGKNQLMRPSGVIVSKDGKYHYWSCSVSGVATFAKPPLWKSTMAKYKTEENLVKTYVCRKAKKYLEAGYTAEQIREIVKNHKGNLPPIEPKIKKHPNMPKKVRKQRLKAIKTETVVEVVNGRKEEVVKKVYPWSEDPNYFKDGIRPPVDVAEITKDTCMYPNRYLDSECQGCPVYNECVYAEKYTEDDWKSGKKRKSDAVVVHSIDSYSEDEIKAST
jgi:hypothetical protein